MREGLESKVNQRSGHSIKGGQISMNDLSVVDEYPSLNGEMVAAVFVTKFKVIQCEPNVLLSDGRPVSLA